jgi:hypothetical protein
MPLEIPYCIKVEANSLKPRIYEDVLENFDTYGLDEAWKTTMLTQGLKSFQMIFDPFDVKGDPVFMFHQLLQQHGLQYKVDWIKNNIERILKSVHLVDSNKSYKSEVRDSLLVRIGKMDASIKKEGLEDTILKNVLDGYLALIISDDFTVKKLNINQINAYCARIEVETFNDWVEVGPSSSQRLNPKFKKKLFFMLNVNEIHEHINYSFNWASSEENFRKLFDYLMKRNYIAASTTLEVFKVVFSRIPLSDISNPILWVDRGEKNAKEYTSGLLVELIHHLSHIGFINEKYMNPRNREQVIESCFRLGNCQNIKVANKRISSPQQRTNKVKELIDFLEGLNA